MGTIANCVREAVRERYMSYWCELVPHFPQAARDDTYYVSSYSRTIRKDFRRFIIRHSAVDFGEGFLESPAAWAREYLAIKKLGRRSRQEQNAMCYTLSSPHFSKETWGDLVYVDLRSAYFSILTHTHCGDLWPGQFWIRGLTDLSDCHSAKIIRRILPTLAKSSDATVYQNGELHRQKLGNKNHNPSLWLECQSVLNAIAAVAVDVFGAVYVHTDGYIFRDFHNTAESFRDWLASDLGLESSVKLRGRGFVCGYGHYTIGRHHSQSRAFGDCDHVDRTFTDWILQRFTTWKD
jgi:hypothetical protein